MNSVILAAGRGSRLGCLTSRRPKGLVDLDGKPLLQWQIESLVSGGSNVPTIVTGYKHEVIEKSIKAKFLYNSNWSCSNMIESLHLALNNIGTPLIVSYSDIIYHSDIVRKLISDDSAISIAYDPNWRELWEERFIDPLSDAETFEIDKDSNLMSIGERPKYIDNIKGQFMGLFKINNGGCEMILSILKENSSLISELDTTGLLNRLTAAGIDIRCIPIEDGWCEIDSPTDLQIAENMVTSGKLKFKGIKS